MGKIENALYILGYALCTLVLFLIIFSIYRYYTQYYETDYFGKLSLPSVRSRYETLVSVWGEPNEIVTLSYEPEQKYGKKYWLNCVYDDFSIKINSDSPIPVYNDSVSSCTIYSERFRFGKYNIGVGSSKDEVESAYKKYWKVVKDSTVKDENIIAYQDKSIHAEYTFDENNIVNEICIFWW
ncbi:MAG: hypothetical protein LUD81_04870 [Clostridiales bacterium]|nr:hypothetical protein [Clostridiales bacterium]